MVQSWQLFYVKRFVYDILDSPDSVWDHMHQFELRPFCSSPKLTLRRMITGTAISITYGIEVKPKDDPFVKLAVEVTRSLIDVMVPGKFLVDSLPYLEHIPDWTPGASFKRETKEFKKLTDRLRDEPFQAAVDAMNKGVAQPCLVSQGLQRLAKNVKNSREVKEETH
ncbi:O-methylsterigmatocystin oxidoreductase [Leucoagaricus sp. SymC.cos]|nr:O-methylsterigmatocystin oxidoreductase [Leucoagaricus sp. SymC.cos]